MANQISSSIAAIIGPSAPPIIIPRTRACRRLANWAIFRKSPKVTLVTGFYSFVCVDQDAHSGSMTDSVRSPLPKRSSLGRGRGDLEPLRRI